MASKVKVELTVKEAEVLSEVAGNGWGDGEYGQAYFTDIGDRQGVNAYYRAIEKLDMATAVARRRRKAVT